MKSARIAVSTGPPLVGPRAEELGPMLVQALLVNAVADGTELRGTWRTLALSLGAERRDLAVAVEELDAVGWVTTAMGGDGTVTMRWADDEHLPDDAAGPLSR